jgi:hypothetical protein
MYHCGVHDTRIFMQSVNMTQVYKIHGKFQRPYVAIVDIQALDASVIFLIATTLSGYNTGHTIGFSCVAYHAIQPVGMVGML